MSSFGTVTDRSVDPVYSDERGMQVLAAELQLEIGSYLGVHDQLAMRKVCKSWRSILDMSQEYLSRYVDIDVSKMPEPPANQQLANRNEQQSATRNRHISMAVSGNVLEHALRMYVKKNTKVVIIRHMVCNYATHGYDGLYNGNTFRMVARVLKEKGANLFQLVYKDCETPEQCGASNYWWTNPPLIVLNMVPGLVSVTRKLTLDTYTFRNALGGIAPSPDMMMLAHMPCIYPIQDRLAAGNMYKKLPIVLPRHEFDCSKPFRQLFCSFMMALSAQCPPTSPVVRDDIVQLCSFWSHCEADQRQWLILHNLIKCFNEGVTNTEMLNLDVYGHVTVDVGHITALRQLDPLSLNKLTTEVLHRMYCLPSRGLVYPPPARCPYKDMSFAE